MPLPPRGILQPPAGFRSREAGLFVAQLDDQTDRLRRDTHDLTAADLAWQPAPGVNAVGMLIAHIAIVEVCWIQVAVHSRPHTAIEGVLGIGIMDDGMPIAAGGGYPQSLHGRGFAYFDDLLARARAFTKRSLADLSDADMDREIDRPGPGDGWMQVANLRWVLYHMVEHQAGHYGQINLLRRQRSLLPPDRR